MAVGGKIYHRGKRVTVPINVGTKNPSEQVLKIYSFSKKFFNEYRKQQKSVLRSKLNEILPD